MIYFHFLHLYRKMSQRVERNSLIIEAFFYFQARKCVAFYRCPAAYVPDSLSPVVTCPFPLSRIFDSILLFLLASSWFLFLLRSFYLLFSLFPSLSFSRAPFIRLLALSLTHSLDQVNVNLRQPPLYVRFLNQSCSHQRIERFSRSIAIVSITISSRPPVSRA